MVTERLPEVEKRTPVTDLDKLFTIYYRAKEAAGRAPNTLDRYRDNFSYFLQYLTVVKLPHTWDSVTTDVIRDYIVWMQRTKVQFEGHRFKPKGAERKGLSPITVNTRLKMLRGFCKFLYTEQYVQDDPMRNIQNMREPQEPIQVLTATELRTLLAIPNQRRFAGFRDHVLMTFLVDTYLRISEALDTKITDIEFSTGVLTVRGTVAKSRKYRVIPLDRHTVKLLSELIKESADFQSEYVFLSNYGERLNSNNFRHALHRYAKEAGITTDVHPHLFRHTAATMFLENGGDIRHLQMLLGHQDLRMVLRYTHLSAASLRRQHEQYSPLNSVIAPASRARRIMREEVTEP